jgi:hypothetical protein
MKRRSLYASTRFVEGDFRHLFVSGPLSTPFDCLFEGPALGCEEGLGSIDLVRPCQATLLLL